jgi:hypothetical protein
LIRGNNWCRVVDDGAYRLHATNLNPAATALQWTGVYLPRDFIMHLRAAYAVEDSVPVKAVLEATGSDGTTLRTDHVFSSADEQSMQLKGPSRPLNPLTVTLSVEPVSPLCAGQRAVIDISSIEATSAKA